MINIGNGLHSMALVINGKSTGIGEIMSPRGEPAVYLPKPFTDASTLLARVYNQKVSLSINGEPYELRAGLELTKVPVTNTPEAA
jgi:hypothetical protein